MPTFPPAVPTLTSGQLTLDALLAYPTLILRALAAIPQQRFISDQLLTMRAQAQGGAIMFGQTEGIYAGLPAESIAPGEEYPQSPFGGPPYALAGVAKWGIDVPVTFESVRRLNFDVMARGAIKAHNTVVQKVDGVALAAIAAAPIGTVAATAAWSAGGAKILLDVQTASAQIIDRLQGYVPDTLVMSTGRYVSLSADTTLQAALRREDPTNPVYQGLGQLMATDPNGAETGFKIAGLTLFAVPTASMPAGVTAMVMDRSKLGGMADEEPLSSKPILEEKLERWLLRAKRVTVPFVMEPLACVNITGA